MIVGFYARVSTEEQRERSTIDAQVEYARRRAELEGWELRLFLDDGVSGTIPLRERPAGAMLLAAVAAHEVQVVATYKLDRLGRLASVIHEAIAQLERLGVSYRSFAEPFDTATPAGTLFMQMLAAFAQFDRAVFLERSRAGVERVAKQDGRWIGGIVPYGYRKQADSMLAIDEAPMPGLSLSEADVVREIFRRCAEDGWPTNRIAVDLNARGIPTSYARDEREHLAGEILGTRAPRAGKRRRATQGIWYAGAVLRILKAEIYRGEHRYGKRGRARAELITRSMPAIVSPALWQRAQLQLVANNRWNNRGAKRTYLLRGLLTCSCGHTLIGTAWKNGDSETRVYSCIAHPDRKTATRVRSEQIEPLLWADIEAFLAEPDAVVERIARGRAPAGAREDRAERELLAIATVIADLEQGEARLIDLYAHPAGKAITPAVLEQRLAAARVKLVAARARQAELRDERAHAARMEAEAKTVRRVLASFAERARTATDEQKQLVLRELVAQVTVTRRGRGHRIEVRYRFGSEHEFAAAHDTGVRDDQTWESGLALVVQHELGAPR